MDKDYNTEEESVILRMLQAVAVPVLGNVCYVFMNGLNTVQVCEFVCHLKFHTGHLLIFSFFLLEVVSLH